ncbi:hypothetical protein PATSB16_05800 [Pandoraea thiooxydans]|nr:hypothetical protein PATSB16_05800 [Pandoraea thiooxydans]
MSHRRATLGARSDLEKFIMSSDSTAVATVLRHPVNNEEIAACYPAMRELRPHLSSQQEFMTRVSRQFEQGYRLLAAWRGSHAVALAGYRLQENLVYGRFLYVDDLVALETERRGRLGQRLLEALADEARAQGCAKLVLDTALSNALAQRFYYRQGMLATAMRFNLALNKEVRPA